MVFGHALLLLSALLAPTTRAALGRLPGISARGRGPTFQPHDVGPCGFATPGYDYEVRAGARLRVVGRLAPVAEEPVRVHNGLGPVLPGGKGLHPLHSFLATKKPRGSEDVLRELSHCSRGVVEDVREDFPESWSSDLNSTPFVLYYDLQFFQHQPGDCGADAHLSIREDDPVILGGHLQLERGYLCEDFDEHSGEIRCKKLIIGECHAYRAHVEEGRGTSGTVHKVTGGYNMEKPKIVKTFYRGDGGADLRQEMRVLARLQSSLPNPNVEQFYGGFPSSLNMVIEEIRPLNILGRLSTVDGNDSPELFNFILRVHLGDQLDSRKGNGGRGLLGNSITKQQW